MNSSNLKILGVNIKISSSVVYKAILIILILYLDSILDVKTFPITM
ncbi:MAG: hypothetical protein ACK5LT_04455 [Lachnospirales bacterium]